MLRSTIRKAVEANRDYAMQLLQEMIRTPSLSGSEGDMQQLVAREFRKLQLDVDEWDISEDDLRTHPAYIQTPHGSHGRPNVVGTWRGTGGGRSLILNGHVDVVPTGSENKWRHDPWGAEVVDGRIYGRGSSDMKAGCTANILTVKVLQAVGVRLRGDLILQSVVDEETGGNGTLGCIMRGYRADACIFTEPTGIDSVAISSRGAQFFRITITGQEGGIEYQQSLVNPISKALGVIEAISDYSVMRESDVSHPLYSIDGNAKVPLGVCRIQAGEWPSTIPSLCTLEGTIECLPGENIHEVKQTFRNALLNWAKHDPWYRSHPLEIEWFGLSFESAETDVDCEFVEALRTAAKEVTNTVPRIAGGGGCDLRLPIIYANTPAVLFGPGGGMIHSTDEYVEFEQMMDCIEILALTTARWCGASEAGT